MKTSVVSVAQKCATVDSVVLNVVFQLKFYFHKPDYERSMHFSSKIEMRFHTIIAKFPIKVLMNLCFKYMQQ